MAWIPLAILFIALTTTSAYKFPYSSYYQPYGFQNYRVSQYRRIDDRSFEQETRIPVSYQERSRYIQTNDEEQHADSSQLSERSVERSIPFGYSQQRVQDEVRVAPKLDDGQLRNGNTSYKILNNLLKTHPSVMNRRGVDTDSAVVFPGPTSGTHKLFNPKIKDECAELGICENSPDYPHEYVEELLAKLPDANIRFNLDVETPEIAQRGGHNQPKSNLSVELCKPIIRIIYPDLVRTKSGKEVFVVNGKKKKVQGFRGTQCRSPGKPCEDLVSVPLNYRAVCEQKTTDRFMWALDEYGAMELVTVPMPSCCSCVLQVVT